MVIYPDSSKDESKVGILTKRMGVMQGYAISVGLFKITETTESRLKLIEMENSLHLVDDR